MINITICKVFKLKGYEFIAIRIKNTSISFEFFK